MTAKLTTHEPGNTKTFDVSEAGLTIGRHVDNQASLDDSRLSRFHARIKFKAGAWYAEDLGSTNGSFLNDRQFEGEVKLAPGDKLRFGATEAELVWETAATKRSSAPSPASPQKTEVLQKPQAIANPSNLKTAATIVAPVSSLMKELPNADSQPPSAPSAPAITPVNASPTSAKHVVLTPISSEAELKTIPNAEGMPVKPLVITPASPEEIASLELTPVEPNAGDAVSPIKAGGVKPLIRKPTGGGLKPVVKLPPKPAAGLKPGVKLPPKPAGLKPGIKVPAKAPFQLKPGLKLPPKPGAGGPAK